MSDCRNIENDLSALIDGELPGGRQAEVIEHVDRCPQCSQRVAELQKLVTGIAALPAAPLPPQFLADVRRKLRQEKSSWVDRLFRPVWWKVPLEACAAVLIVAGVMAWLRPTPSQPPVLAKAETTGMRAKILLSDALDKSDGAREEKRADRTEVLREAAAAPAAPVVMQPQVAAASVGEPPKLPEALVVRGDSVVAVRLRVENLAKQLDGRVAPGVPTNTFLVYLPQSQVAAFRSQIMDARAKGNYALGAPAEKQSSAEPVVGVQVIVEP